ncbi:hypothetical protein RUM44_005981 [Polyplax serrata]|uniref:Uncharacterized protein n=1 Tax=Polyplax serrata TaxID=468196 RepID=A0ABR1AYR0_POLSC
MVDIALGTPEIGAVNFNVLHALIHVIIQQLNIQKCLVEFKGYDSERMEGIILSAKPEKIEKGTKVTVSTDQQEFTRESLNAGRTLTRGNQKRNYGVLKRVIKNYKR